MRIKLLQIVVGLAITVHSAVAFGATGYLHEGSIVVWGNNDVGQQSVPSGNTFTQLATGGWHGLAVRSDGSLASWGYNAMGQTNVPAGNNFRQVAAGEYFSLTIKSDGSLAAWGHNSGGETNPPPGNNYTQISAYGYQGVALKSDGSIATWAAYPALAGNNFTQIAEGYGFYIVRKTDGSLAAWGVNNDEGKLNVPSGNNFTNVAAGSAHALAVKSDGTLAGWGWNYYGQATVPAGNNFEQVAAGYGHSLALKTDGTLAGWGSNLGSGAPTYLQYVGQATVPAGNNFIQVAAAQDLSAALAGRQSYQDLLIQDVAPFTKNDTLLRRSVVTSGNVNINGSMDWVLGRGILNVGGQVNIAGGSELNVFLGDVQPVSGQHFKLFNTSTSMITGYFSSLHLPPLNPPLSWDTSHLYSTGTLDVIPEPASMALFAMCGLLALQRRKRT